MESGLVLNNALMGVGCIGIRPGTGSSIGETLAELLSRINSSNSGEPMLRTALNDESRYISEDLKYLKDITGLSWVKIAELFGVSRRAVYDWLEGRSVSDKNYLKLISMKEAIRGSGLKKSFQVRIFLMTQTPNGITPFEMLKNEDYSGFSRARLNRADEDTSMVDTRFISLKDRLSAEQETVHVDLPGERRTKASRRSPGV